MAITDNRTLLDNANETTNWDDAAGGQNTSANSETFILGSGSQSLKISNTTNAILYDAGSAQDWSNNHFYIWWNVSTAGKLNTKGSGGVRVRFCGATVGNFFEVYVDGSDTYSGGFTMSVIDIETAAADPQNFNSPPATTAVRYVGVFFDVTAMISGNIDNCFVDAIWRLPASTPGILVEGQNTGSVDWTWQDIVDAADDGDTTKAWGTAFRRDGVVFINTPIRFGANDAVTHGFSDTSEVVAWENQLVASDLYELEVIGGSGTQSFALGTRVGTGDSSVGSEGCAFTADTTGQRYAINAIDANIDAAEFFGCTFLHASTIDVSNVNSEARSNLFSDVSTLTQADGGGDGTFQKNTSVNANTADGVAFLASDNLSTIKNNSFVFSDGHAIELTSTAGSPYTFEGNSFAGYGGTPGSNLVASTGSNDACIYNNSGGAVIINVSGGGDLPSIRNGASATTTVNDNINLTVTVQDSGAVAISGAEVAVFLTSDDSVILASTTTDENGQVSTTATKSSGAIYIRVRQSTNTSTFHTDTGVNGGTETITTDTAHSFADGEAVVYDKDGGTDVIDITDGTTYYVNDTGTSTLQLYDTALNAINGVGTGRQGLTASGGTETHKLDPVRYIPNSTVGTIGTTDFSVTVTMTVDTTVTG
jgi:hypothetical protein